MQNENLINSGSDFTVKLTVGTAKNAFQWTAGGFYKYNGVQVLGPRATGWTAGTGTPNKGAFAADTATAAQAAQRVLAIEQALRTHGLIN